MVLEEEKSPNKSKWRITLLLFIAPKTTTPHLWWAIIGHHQVHDQAAQSGGGGGYQWWHCRPLPPDSAVVRATSPWAGRKPSLPPLRSLPYQRLNCISLGPVQMSHTRIHVAHRHTHPSSIQSTMLQRRLDANNTEHVLVKIYASIVTISLHVLFYHKYINKPIPSVRASLRDQITNNSGHQPLSPSSSSGCLTYLTRIIDWKTLPLLLSLQGTGAWCWCPATQPNLWLNASGSGVSSPY